jgi:Family of unknown function (DUF6069)
MSTTSTARPARLGTAVQSRSLLQGSAAGAAAATLVNAALWTGGHAAGVSFMVSSAFMTQVGIVAVVITTLLAFAVGSGLLAWPPGVPAGGCVRSSSQPPYSPWSRQALPCLPRRTPRPACCWRPCT